VSARVRARVSVHARVGERACLWVHECRFAITFVLLCVLRICPHVVNKWEMRAWACVRARMRARFHVRVHAHLCVAAFVRVRA
jgi:hypothetical protein